MYRNLFSIYETGMVHMKVEYQTIGLIHSPFKDIKDMPIQTVGASGIQGTVEVFPAFIEGLQDLKGFSHIFLLYHFHQIRKSALVVTPFLDSQPRGVFATRAPKRPNPIGLSVVKLFSIEKNIIHIENVDILDGTPLLDIKPYVPEFDHHPSDRFGWLEKVKRGVRHQKSDGRFR
jgi:tRNA-Thr(GGU) m(6)t(6)A37 methyltransferase TsaA